MDDKMRHSRRPPQSFAFSAYGSLHSGSRGDRLCYNGQLLDRLVQGYFLGNGRRLYRPVLMRFCSPDAFSPFEKGGLNSYAYCGGDPVNFSDPQGTTRFKQNWAAFEPVFKKINNTDKRVQGFAYHRARSPGERIEPFRAKSVDGKILDRSDPSASLRGKFYVNRDRSLFISEYLVTAEGIEMSPLKPLDKNFIEEGFVLMNVNPDHVVMENGRILPDPDMIFINESGIDDYSKPNLAMPRLAAAIRKGRRPESSS